MIKVILDTNFLVYCAKERLDYKEEISKLVNEGFVLVVPTKVIEELKKIILKKKEKNSFYKILYNPRFRKTTGKDKEASELALKLLEHNKVDVVETQGETVDKAIINLANENKKNIVATLDKEMRNILGRVILINKGKKLMLTK